MVDASLSHALVDFIREAPTSFHAVRAIASRLDAAGFTRLSECERWGLERGGRYYVIRNDSALVGFRIGGEVREPSFTIALTHADSPTLRLKPAFEMEG
jgi:aspartyl aminopeptidase